MIKTVNLNGTELVVNNLGGFNTVVHNLGAGSIYASKYPGVSAGGDNVAEIPSGAAKLISTTNGTIFLLGSGKVELTGQDHDGVNFKQPSSSGGGGGETDVSKAYVDAQDSLNLGQAKSYTDTAVNSVKGDVSALQTGKADKTEIPVTLPANGGNSDTVNNHTVNADVPAGAEFTDTKYTLPPASGLALGGVKTGYAANGKNYPVELSGERMYVNVPWTDTTYPEVTSGTAGLMSAGDKIKLDSIDPTADASNKMDKTDPAGSGSFSLNRKSGTVIGACSFAEGYETTASGICSHAEGGGNSTIKDSDGNIVTNIASGYGAHVEGASNTASGFAAHAEGSGTTASGNWTHTQGYFTTASNPASFAGGKFNKAMTTGAASHTSAGDVFVLGNGTKNGTAAAVLSNAFRVTYTGAVYGVGAFNTTGADYAEFIKPWFDDNPNHEDRVGYFVTVKNGKLLFAEPHDYIVGITSGNPSVVGNGDEDWLGRWQRDEFNRIVTEDDEETIEVVDEVTGEISYKKTGKIIKNARFKANPDYDPSQKYIERKDRPEWDYVGMIGVLPVRDDGSCIEGGFAKCGSGGIATAADDCDCSKTFFVIERISENVVSVEMR